MPHFLKRRSQRPGKAAPCPWADARYSKPSDSRDVLVVDTTGDRNIAFFYCDTWRLKTNGTPIPVVFWMDLPPVPAAPVS